MNRDRLGRRRSPEQERGLRPLHPPLPDQWISKAVRVAMSDSDWAHFEALVSRHADTAESQARAHGQAISELLHALPGLEPAPGPLNPVCSTSGEKLSIDLG